MTSYQPHCVSALPAAATDNNSVSSVKPSRLPLPLRAPGRARSIAMSMFVCLSVCLSLCVCLFACMTRKLNVRFTPNFLCMLPMPVARSSSDGIAIRYVLPVLWMALCVRSIGPIVQILARRYISIKFAGWQHHLDVSQTTSVWSRSSECGTWGKVCCLLLPCITQY